MAERIKGAVFCLWSKLGLDFGPHVVLRVTNIHPQMRQEAPDICPKAHDYCQRSHPALSQPYRQNTATDLAPELQMRSFDRLQASRSVKEMYLSAYVLNFYHQCELISTIFRY